MVASCEDFFLALPFAEFFLARIAWIERMETDRKEESYSALAAQIKICVPNIHVIRVIHRQSSVAAGAALGNPRLS
jgi:hypothetical protein